MTKEFFNIWLNDNFLKESIYKNVKVNIIIFDRATSYYDQDNIELFKMNESNFIVMPAGQTRDSGKFYFTKNFISISN